MKVLKKASDCIKSAPTPCLARPANAASHSCGLAALRTTTCRASFSAAPTDPWLRRSRLRLVGLARKATAATLGTSITKQLEPLGDQHIRENTDAVMLPPGRFRLATNRRDRIEPDGGDDRRGRGRRLAACTTDRHRR